MTVKPSSLKSVIRVWVLGFGLVALVVSSLFLVKYADDELDGHLQLAAKLIQLYSDDTVSIEYGRKNYVYVEDSLRRLNQLLDGDKARIRSNDGAVIESTDSSEVGSTQGAPSRHFKILSAVIREHSSGEPLGTLEVVVNRDHFMTEAIRKAILPTLILFLTLFVTSIFTIRSLQRRVIRPIKQLLSSRPVSIAESSQWPTEIHDLSGRLQNALKQRDLAMIGQISSGIIHDLKTSLQSLKGGVELVKGSDTGSPRRAQCLELLLKSADFHVPKMDALVSTTLDGSRTIQIRATSANLESTVLRSIKSHSEMIEKYQVALDLDLASLSNSVPHDPTQMERAISNILKNAIEATAEKDGASARRIAIHCSEDGEIVSLAIEDSGPGLRIAPEELLRSVRTTKTHGSGLGLWVSRKIIEAHRGKLAPGKSERLSGARFEIRIPKSGRDLA